MPRYNNTFSITSNGLTEYIIETTGYLHGESVDNHENVGEKRAAGHVNGGVDTYSYNGVFQGIDFPEPNAIGDYTLKRNGHVVDPFHLNQRELIVESPADKAPYELSVSGRLIGSGRTNASEHIFGDGQRATGRVRDGKDVWYYTGVLTGADSNQELNLTVDGSERTVPGVPPSGI